MKHGGRTGNREFESEGTEREAVQICSKPSQWHRKTRFKPRLSLCSLCLCVSVFQTSSLRKNEKTTHNARAFNLLRSMKDKAKTRRFACLKEGKLVLSVAANHSPFTRTPSFFSSSIWALPVSFSGFPARYSFQYGAKRRSPALSFFAISTNVVCSVN